jgi:2,4-dienoyl-CoA reductase (NADPH2)
MDEREILEVIQQFVDGARRAREAGLDGVELHGANGYLITQFLSSGINDREDGWGGPLENRARFLLEVVRAIRREVGRDFHLQVKISAVDHNDAVTFWSKPGNTLDESVQICRWLEEAGVDCIHVSVGSLFPHPWNPPGTLPLPEAERDYSIMLPSGTHTFRNYLLFRYSFLRPIFQWLWNRTRPEVVEGINLPFSRAVKQAVGIPVLVTGGFQTAHLIRKAIEDGDCDGVSMARTLLANPDLPQRFAAGHDTPERPCTYCNRCLLNVLEHPLACYEPVRFDSYESMMDQVRSYIGPDMEDPGRSKPAL